MSNDIDIFDMLTNFADSGDAIRAVNLLKDFTFYMIKYHPDYELAKNKFIEEKIPDSGFNIPTYMIRDLLNDITNNPVILNIVQNAPISAREKVLKEIDQINKPNDINHGVVFNNKIIFTGNYNTCMKFLTDKDIDIGNYNIYTLDKIGGLNELIF